MWWPLTALGPSLAPPMPANTAAILGVIHSPFSCWRSQELPWCLVSAASPVPTPLRSWGQWFSEPPPATPLLPGNPLESRALGCHGSAELALCVESPPGELALWENQSPTHVSGDWFPLVVEYRACCPAGFLVTDRTRPPRYYKKGIEQGGFGLLSCSTDRLTVYIYLAIKRHV